MISQPYAASAMDYFAAGWTPLPLPPRKKAPVPAGFTGGTATRPGKSRIRTWVANNADSNVGLRMPDNVIALDVDDYGDKTGITTLKELEKQLGDLPRSWSSRNRPGEGGHYFYRVPAGRHWENQPSIDLIWWGHRYSVVCPSIHPDGRQYNWYYPSGQLVEDEFPCPSDLPELPEAWVNYLTGTSTDTGEVAEMSEDDTRAWIAQLPNGKMCDGIRNSQDAALEWLRTSNADGTHDHIRDVLFGLLADGNRGCSGVSTAVYTLEAAFKNALRDRRSRAALDSEWDRMLTRAVKKIKAQRAAEHAEECDCGMFDQGMKDNTVLNEVRMAALRERLLSFDALMSMPDPEYLIKGVLDKSSLAQLFGKSGHHKSFVAIDMSCHVATGAAEWCGRRCRAGRVVYMAAEGSTGIKKRIQAWAKEHKVKSIPDLLVFAGAVISSSKDWPYFIEMLREVDPVLVVLDTQARVTAGADENQSKDMGEFIAAADAVVKATGATVLAIHHEGLVDGRARGSTAVFGALDQQFRVLTTDEGMVEFHNPKQKDLARDEGIVFWPTSVYLGDDPDGEPITSLVLEWQKDEKVSDGAKKRSEAGEATANRILEVVRDCEWELTKSGVKKAVGGNSNAFHREWDLLLSGGAIVVEDRKITNSVGRQVSRPVVGTGTDPVRLRILVPGGGTSSKEI